VVLPNGIYTATISPSIYGMLKAITSLLSRDGWDSLNERETKNRHLWILVITGVLIYANTVDNSFHLDDYYRVHKNPGIEKVWPVTRHFTDPGTMSSIPRINAFRPLLPLTLSINHAIDGYYFRGYHLFNIGVHIAAAIVVYYLLSELILQAAIFESAKRRGWLAFTASLLFLIHPVSGIPVNYICARDLLMTELFSMYAFYRYIRMRRTSEKSWGIILASFVLALLSKGNAVVIPGLILVYEWSLRKQPVLSKESFLRALPFFLIVAGFFAYTRFVLEFSEVENVVSGNIPAWVYPFTQFKLHLFRYIFNFVWPLSIHQAPHIEPPALTDLAPWGGLLFILITLFIAVRYWKTNPVIGFCIFAYWMLLAPTSSIFPFYAYAVDYRPYPSSAFFYFLVSYSAFTFLSDKRLIAVAVAVTVYIAGMSLFQNTTWRTDETLWKYSLSKSGSPLAHLNYAMAVADLPVREKHLRKTLEMAPDYILAKTNLGLLLIEKGEYNDGLSLMIQAVKQQPKWEQTKKWLRVGIDKIDSHFDKIDENQKTELLATKADALLTLGEYADSIPVLKALTGALPNDTKSLFMLGFAYQSAGETGKAIETYNNYLKQAPPDYHAYFNIAQAQMSLGKCEEAVNNFRNSLRLNPSLEEARKNILICEARSKGAH